MLLAADEDDDDYDDSKNLNYPFKTNFSITNYLYINLLTFKTD